MKKMILAATVLALAGMNLQTAQAGERDWAVAGKILTSVAVGAVIVNALDARPVYVAPAPVYCPPPAPVYCAPPAPVYCAPTVVYTQPAVIYHTRPVFVRPQFAHREVIYTHFDRRGDRDDRFGRSHYEHR